ncbi:MAG: ABC transporter ATP-binding protein [Microcystis sp. Msp_OC_L_20101000_S702]|jgi:ABC-2 type transport system ATP-binding protein|uniref:ABC transporter ATP-binding protein n=1 Tax=Microcystis aeruginosa DA14 TaxID=1987506 RepID=A0A3E0MJE3_MICAE|nr:ABC transporter ATP-binding protein [Microcystis sp. Msp_OC_L_20101000_S702]REJ59939.1 MAG: ABC transporter ATP-binding protein [Microcystis aeruginosa DA14]TRU04510.1 MAG: ABC transporter ATP-binding protein [Microcystis sp. Msp_OC_L_20101000_S702]
MLETSSATSTARSRRAQEVQKLVENNQMDLATKRLMDFVGDFGTNQVSKPDATDIRRRFVAMRDDKRRFPEKDFGEQETKLVYSILELIESILEYSELPKLIAISTRNSNYNSLDNVSDASQEIGENQELDSSLTSDETTNFRETPLERAKRLSREQKKDSSSITLQPSDANVVFLGEDITKTYRGKSGQFTLSIPKVELKLEEITAIVGENGNGKTTLLKIITGNLRKTGGQIRYPALDKDNKQDLYKIKQQIAYIPQELSEWEGLLADNLHFSAAIHGIKGKTNEEEVDFIISRLGLDKYRDYTWKEISGGFKMRFALAKALVWNPKLLILDEPLANLDINTQLLFLQDLRYLADSLMAPKSIILSSQNIYDVENIADNIIFIKDGQALYNGNVQVFAEQRRENTFELGCQLSKEKLTDLLQEIDYYGIDMVGHHQFLVDTPRNVTSRDILNLFANQQNISLSYFRDISKSTRKLFKKEK